ncbi:hypothetical protein BKA82DRAFT_4223110 [Pisolithus tinctorius]|nr:hypothetical protein BKA82DRAFT_4223110 [Pisolithus tinctorius]
MTTISPIKLAIDADNKPVNLPGPEAIIQLCRDAARARFSATNSNSNYLRGVPLTYESHGATACVWVKYGPTITMGEALTQHFVAQAINGKADAAVRVPSVYLAFRSRCYGYIVMEYIDGSTCDDSDAELVAAAVRSLIAIRGPTAAPGPVGGGPIVHRFFADWESSVTYDSVQLLEEHVNRILAHEGRSERVSFGPEVEAHGLRLCPCDMNQTNFMKDLKGMIVALDFGASCFLPPSFFAFALHEGDYFTQLVARRLKHPASTQLKPMLIASYILVVFGTNKIGIPPKLKNTAK